MVTLKRDELKAGQVFQQIDQPTSGVQNAKPPCEFFLAIDFIEQFERAHISRVLSLGIAKSMEARRKFGAASFQAVVALAKALPLPRWRFD